MSFSAPDDNYRDVYEIVGTVTVQLVLNRRRCWWEKFHGGAPRVAESQRDGAAAASRPVASAVTVAYHAAFRDGASETPRV